MPPKKLLIVDDSPSVRRLLRMLAEPYFDEIAECDRGSEAVNAYGSTHPDLVLMDIALPDMDGLSATGKIKLEDPDANVVIVSNHDREDLRVAAREAGACGYIGKQNLLDVIDYVAAVGDRTYDRFEFKA